jgi:hypothetical protein
MPIPPDSVIVVSITRGADQSSGPLSSIGPAGSARGVYRHHRALMDPNGAPQPVRVPESRLSRWAVIAALAAALALLVVVAPRFVPGPNASSSTSPAQPRVLTAQQFADGVRSGALAGQTVLVTSAIVPGPPVPRAACDAPGPQLCFLGDLEGIEPLLEISARLTASTESEAMPPAYATNDPSRFVEVAWPYYYFPHPPIAGTLVLFVTGHPIQQVEYLGRLRLTGSDLTSTAQQTATLDPTSLALDEVVLVDAWLGGIGDVQRSCLPPDPGFEGLAARAECGSLSWLTDAPSLPNPNSEIPPANSVQVQADAYPSFAPTAVAQPPDALAPQRGTYVLARRLFGRGCGDQTVPCWGWAIVGRLSQPPGVTLTPAPARTIDCSPPPNPPLGGPPNGHATVYDETGLVDSCEGVAPSGITPDPFPVSNPNADQMTLQVEWSGTPCDVAVTLRFEPRAYGYYLEGERPGGVCRLSSVAYAIRLHLLQPVQAHTVLLQIQSQTMPIATPTSPTAVLSTPDFAARLGAGELDGQTVLVQGRIGPDLRRGPFCPPDHLCHMGPLEGTEPAIDVSGRGTPTVEGEDASNASGMAWEWWYRPPAPEGILTLSVDQSSQVEYLGRVRSSGSPLTWTAQGVAGFDPASMGLDEVVLIDAWLTGVESYLFCSPHWGIASLPSRHFCDQPTWLTDDPVALDPSHVRAPQDSVQVQQNAYRDFAPNLSESPGVAAVPQRAVYAVARRLFGDGCDDAAPPCWGWSIVARTSLPPLPSLPPQGRPTATGAGCGPVSLPSIGPEMTYSPIGRPPYQPLSGNSSVEAARARGIDLLLPLHFPNDLRLQLVDLYQEHPGKGEVAVTYAASPLDSTDTYLDLIRNGGFFLSEQFPPSQDATAIERQHPGRVTFVQVGPYLAALIWGDPIADGVRAYGLYWSDGTRGMSIQAGFDTATQLVDVARSIYCASP